MKKKNRKIELKTRLFCSEIVASSCKIMVSFSLAYSNLFSLPKRHYFDIKSEKEYLDSVRFGGVKPETEMLKAIAGKFIKHI